jgi:hypothetical protein
MTRNAPKDTIETLSGANAGSPASQYGFERPGR